MDNLRRAVRALAGLDPTTLGSVTPEAMRRVCLSRGWTLHHTCPFPGEPDRVAFEIYDHPTAMGQNSYGVPSVMLPVDPTAEDYFGAVVGWAGALATRHGDVAPAEVLAEVLDIEVVTLPKKLAPTRTRVVVTKRGPRVVKKGP